jgi:hypothetical protein
MAPRVAHRAWRAETTSVATAAKENVKAKAPKAPAKGKAGKAAKLRRQRSEIDDIITLAVCVACTIWAFKVIVDLGALSF